jgi:hypothetical protein
MAVSGTGLSGSASFTADQAGASSFTVTSNATSANTASAIVARDGSGNFSAGTVTAALTGNASTAATLQTARTIGGVSFDGSANINLPGVNSAGNQNTSGNAATATNVAYSGLTGTVPTWNQNTTGNAATATTLQTARTINGVSFNGSANITITAAATNVNTQLASLGVGTAASGTAGEIRATNNITAYYSDDRLKTKLGDIDNALDKIDTLAGFYYEANQTAQDLGYAVIREVGVSAQSVQAIMPEVVAPAPIDDRYLTVRYERLVPLLIQGIKELRAEIKALKGE